MRPIEEIQQAEKDLVARKAEIQSQFEKLVRHTNSDIKVLDEHESKVYRPDVLRTADTLTRWRDEIYAINSQLRVLRWINGEVEHFPYY